jgi:PAS domain S-box-containing protein
VRVLLSEGHPIMRSDGEIEALVGVCHDITDRIATEEALGTSERRMRAIIDNTPSVITVRDLDGRYVMTNAEAGRIFAISPDALIGRRCEDAVGKEIAEKQRASDLIAAAEREPVYDQVVLMSKGEPRTYMTVTFPLPDEKGLPAEMCTIATDVTDSQERETERLDRIAWQEQIDTAIAEGRMRVFAQPIVDLRTGTHTSNELLVRMVTPDEASEVLPPAAFLPAAERFGLIQTIDAWMVGQALKRADGAVAEVNLSAVTLCDRDARDEIVEMLAAAPERASKIIFEITETAVAEHLGAASEFAEDVTNLGCRLALDDFGTGFGSLTYLNNLPLSFIKIDMSFVRDLAATPQDDRLVRSVIEIAGVFDLQTIAEGIEDESTLELLRGLGADYAQGFHLGRPTPLPAAQLS